MRVLNCEQQNPKSVSWKLGEGKLQNGGSEKIRQMMMRYKVK